MLLNETVPWRILGRLFLEPEREFYVKELSRELKMSPGSASTICRNLEKEGILQSRESGRALFYSLRAGDFYVDRLKSAWVLQKLREYRKCWEREEFQSVALYGSCASGEFISKSDIDFMVISNVEGGTVEKLLGPLRKEFGAKFSITAFTAAQWAKKAREKDRFYIEVLSKHIVLYGSPLVVG
jgi:predicted nucleotidyltransferase